MLALVLALVLWFFVKSTVAPVRNVDVGIRRLTALPIEVRNRPVDLDFARIPSGTVSLNVRGSTEALDQLTLGDVLAYVDLRGLGEGTHQMSIRVDVPAGVEVTSATPPRLEVVLERIISTQTSLVLDLRGEPEEGFFAPPGQVEPATVMLTGGRSAVTRVAPFVIVVDVDGFDRSVTSTLALQPLDSQGQVVPGVEVSPEQVLFRQPIWPTRRVPIVIVPGEEQAQFSYEVIPEDVLISAPGEVLRDIEELVVVLDTTDLTQNVTIEQDLVLPPGVYSVSRGTYRIRIIITVDTQ